MPNTLGFIPRSFLRQLPARATLLIGLWLFVLLQIRKIATILRAQGSRNRIGSGPPLLRWLDCVAIGPPWHQAVLHLAGGGQIVREPHPDRQQDDRDDQARDRAAPVVALLGIGHAMAAD